WRRAARGVRRAQRRVRVQSRRYGVLAALWAVWTLVCAVLWLATGLTLWTVATLLSGLVTGMCAVLTFDPRVVETGPAPSRAPRVRSRQTGPSRAGAGTPGPRAAKPRQRECSAECRKSMNTAARWRGVCRGKTCGEM